MLQHPVKLYNDPFVFDALVALHVEVGVPYWIDLVDPNARVRLTNIDTGIYVIMDPVAKTNPKFYPDEDLLRVARPPELRVFDGCTYPMHLYSQLDFTDLPLRAFANRFVGIEFRINESNAPYMEYVQIFEDEITRCRQAQHLLAKLGAETSSEYAAYRLKVKDVHHTIH